MHDPLVGDQHQAHDHPGAGARVVLHQHPSPVERHALHRRPQSAQSRPPARHTRAIGGVFLPEAAIEVGLLGGDDREVGGQEIKAPDQIHPGTVVYEEQAGKDEQVAVIEGIARVREEALAHQSIGVDLLVQAAALDVRVADDGGAQRLPAHRHEEPRQVDPQVAGEAAAGQARAESKEQGQHHQREDGVAVLEQPVSVSDEPRPW